MAESRGSQMPFHNQTLRSLLRGVCGRGVSPTADVATNTRVVIANSIIMLALVMTVMFSVIQGVLGDREVLVANAVSAGFFLGMYGLMGTRLHRAARGLLAIGILAIIFTFILLLGRDIGLQDFLFSLALMPFVLFTWRDWQWMLCLCALIIILYLWLHFGPAFVPLFQLEPATRSRMQDVYRVFAMVSIFFPILILFFINDRQDRRLREHQLSLVKAARLSSIGELAGGIAHEVNNPLAIIELSARGIAADLKRPVPDIERIGAKSQLIIDTVSRIASIVRSLREISHTGTANAATEKCNLASVLRATFDLCRERFKSRGIELMVEGDWDLEVYAHRHELSQALLNLLSNAAHAVTELPQKWIRVSLTSDQDTIKIAVEDSGPGIPAAIRERMFDPFFTTKPVGTGVGLGLGLAASYIRMHGGALQYDPNARGTRFVIELPAKLLRSQPDAHNRGHPVESV